MADATDSKSVDGDIVWVQVPPPAPPVPESFFAVLEFFIVILFKTVLIKLAEAALQNEVLPLLLSVEFFSR